MKGIGDIRESGKGLRLATLIENNRGEYVPCLSNALTYLRGHEEMKDKIHLNQFSLDVEMHGQPPWGCESRTPPFIWSDPDDSRLAERLQYYGINVSSRVAGEAVMVVASENAYNPVLEWLDEVAAFWDGKPRIKTWLHDYLGAEAGEYAEAIGPRFLIQMCARIYRPGCKADCALILEGPQGAMKSSALAVLGGKWFSDDIAELGTKDSKQQLRGAWLIEIAELDSMSRSDITRTKAFISCATDRFRLPYGHRVGVWPRTCCFAGSTNENSYLRDASGGRREWPVKCGEINLERLKADREQLFGEAANCYMAGEKWWLDSKRLVQIAQEEQRARYDGDPWDELIQPFLAQRVAESASLLPADKSQCPSVSVSEILQDCIKKPAMQWTQQDKNRVARSLMAADWERFQMRTHDGKEWRYRPVSPVTSTETEVVTTTGDTQTNES